MSWGISVSGTKKGVVEAVRAAKGYGDESQLEVAKAFIVAEVEKFPDPGPDDYKQPAMSKGIRVTANGHHDASSRSVSISIQQEYVAD